MFPSSLFVNLLKLILTRKAKLSGFIEKIFLVYKAKIIQAGR